MKKHIQKSANLFKVPDALGQESTNEYAGAMKELQRKNREEGLSKKVLDARSILYCISSQIPICVPQIDEHVKSELNRTREEDERIC